MAIEPVDMRLGAERLGALVRDRMRAEPRSRALFVFVGKRGHMKILWDGTGTIVVHNQITPGATPAAAAVIARRRAEVAMPRR